MLVPILLLLPPDRILPFYTTAGTVTSVALATPGVLYTVSGSPVTTSGTLTLNLVNQSANTIFAGPASGSAAAPTFRALVGLDIPVDNSTIFVDGSNQIAVQYMIVSPPESNYFWGYASENNTKWIIFWKCWNWHKCINCSYNWRL